MTLASTSTMTIGEMREFAGFAPCEQRYIKRSLDIGLARCDAFRLWGRTEAENVAIRRQYVAYQDLKVLRTLVPVEGSVAEIERFIGKLVRMTAFDLSQERINSFSAFRFLYERLLGAAARPYLPAAFCAAALKATGPPELLINNAAIINPSARLWEIPAKDFDRLTISSSVKFSAFMKRSEALKIRLRTWPN